MAIGGRPAEAIRLRRIYAAPEPTDGARILVDRLWPRGMSRQAARLDAWLRDLAPSDALRQRLHGHPEDWTAFRAAYAKELALPAAQAALATLRERMDAGTVTLLYAAKDEERNNAVALRLWLLGEDRDVRPACAR
ncbi:MAG: DUF488 family protein [Rhodospirillales bacterium]|jgi:uncharacterized protein YeaO (DUF488 family)|nr:DUF488 family protein [Rhodospirillales bacterium]